MLEIFFMIDLAECSLAPVLGAEGGGEGACCKRGVAVNSTPHLALSPDYRGEGVRPDILMRCCHRDLLELGAQRRLINLQYILILNVPARLQDDLELVDRR